MFEACCEMFSYAERFMRFDEYCLTSSRDSSVNSMLSMPMPTKCRPKRDSHVPAFDESPEIASAMEFAWLGSAEMRYSFDSELSATENDCMNSERICDFVFGSSKLM